MRNTGLKGFRVLEEYFIDTGEPTGRTKPNIPEDPDFIPPTADYVSCPIGQDAELPDGTESLSISWGAYRPEDAELNINGTVFRGDVSPTSFSLVEGLNFLRLSIFNGFGFSLTVNLIENGSQTASFAPGIFDTHTGARWIQIAFGKLPGFSYQIQFIVTPL